jgi:hypothetical protein
MQTGVAIAPRPIERDTPLFRDCAVAERFAKWPHELWELPEELQELYRWYHVLANAKLAYSYLPEDDRKFWPKKPPKRG